MKSREGKIMSKTTGYVCSCEQGVMEDLITDYTTFGIKVAGMQYRVLYGTREVDNVLPN